MTCHEWRRRYPRFSGWYIPAMVTAIFLMHLWEVTR